MSYTVRLVLVCILSGLTCLICGVVVQAAPGGLINLVVGIWLGTGGIGLLLLALLIAHLDGEGDDAD